MSGQGSPASDDADRTLKSQPNISVRKGVDVPASRWKLPIGGQFIKAFRKRGAEKAEAASTAADEHVVSADIGIAEAAEKLILARAERAIFLSPEGDEAASVAVLAARELADAGLAVLLLDLTRGAAASVPMLESATYPGITNLLCRDVRLDEVVHRDLYSDCYLIPSGTADASRAMRAADCLPLLLDTLKKKFDVLVIECGPAPVAAIGMLENERTQILLSVIGVDDNLIAATELALKQLGRGDPIRVTPGGHEPMQSPAARTSAPVGRPAGFPQRISGGRSMIVGSSPDDLAHRRILAQLVAS